MPVQLPADPQGQPQDPLQPLVPAASPEAPDGKTDAAGFPLPTKQVADLSFAAQLPVVPQNLPAIHDVIAPVFGIEPALGNAADLLMPRMTATAKVLDAVQATTKSPAYCMGCNRYEIYPVFSDKLGYCDLNVYLIDTLNANQEKLVKTFYRVTVNSVGLYVGGQDLISIDGQPIKIEAKNISVGCKVTVRISGH